MESKCEILPELGLDWGNKIPSVGGGSCTGKVLNWSNGSCRDDCENQKRVYRRLGNCIFVDSASRLVY